MEVKFWLNRWTGTQYERLTEDDIRANPSCLLPDEARDAWIGIRASHQAEVRVRDDLTALFSHLSFRALVHMVRNRQREYIFRLMSQEGTFTLRLHDGALLLIDPEGQQHLYQWAEWWPAVFSAGVP